MICCGPVGETIAPAKMASRSDPHALRRPALGLTAFASTAFGHVDRPGILRFQGALVIYVVLNNNNKPYFITVTSKKKNVHEQYSCTAVL